MSSLTTNTPWCIVSIHGTSLHPGQYYAKYDFMGEIDTMVAAFQVTKVDVLSDPLCSSECTYTFTVNDQAVDTEEG